MNSGLCLTFVTLVNITDLVLQVYCLLGANNFSPTLHSFKVKLRVSTHLNNGVYLTPPWWQRTWIWFSFCL